MHQLSIFNLAIHYYKLAIVEPPASPDLDLTRESAYNLALIYINSGNPFYARHVYEKFIVFEWILYLSKKHMKYILNIINII